MKKQNDMKEFIDETVGAFNDIESQNKSKFKTGDVLIINDPGKPHDGRIGVVPGIRGYKNGVYTELVIDEMVGIFVKKLHYHHFYEDKLEKIGEL